MSSNARAESTTAQVDDAEEGLRRSPDWSPPPTHVDFDPNDLKRFNAGVGGAEETPPQTGYIDFEVGNETFQTHYVVYGDLNAASWPGNSEVETGKEVKKVKPLVILHGGPGML
jgi:hypothetical protein